MTALITGAAGFIGFHLANRLIQLGIPVIGFDSFNSYYSQELKNSRYSCLKTTALKFNTPFHMIKDELENNNALQCAFDGVDISGATLKTGKPKYVVNLAAQAGVRYSLENPSAYIQSNLVGFGNILEMCRKKNIRHLIYASSSSVYGGNTKLPFNEKDNVDHPISLYAASKKANELMAHTYSHLYGIPTTGLRFFTVYGPWGRPDMALFLFTKAILEGEPIKVFNNGLMSRDFTYITDIVECLVRLIKKPALPDKNFDPKEPNSSTSWSPYRIFNIGNSKPTNLLDYIYAIEDSIGISAEKIMMPIQPGDVIDTASDTSALDSWIGFKPNTSIKEGVNNFVLWYREYYGK